MRKQPIPRPQGQETHPVNVSGLFVYRASPIRIVGPAETFQSNGNVVLVCRIGVVSQHSTLVLAAIEGRI